MECPACGADNEQGASFCAVCGASFESENMRPAGDVGDGETTILGASPTNAVPKEPRREPVSETASSARNPLSPNVSERVEIPVPQVGAVAPPQGQVAAAAFEQRENKEKRAGRRVATIVVAALVFVVIVAVGAMNISHQNHSDRQWGAKASSVYDIAALASMETTQLVDFLEEKGLVEVDASTGIFGYDVEGDLWIAESSLCNEASGDAIPTSGVHESLETIVPGIGKCSPEAVVVGLTSFGNDGDDAQMTSEEIAEGVHQSCVELDVVYLDEETNVYSPVDMAKRFSELCNLSDIQIKKKQPDGNTVLFVGRGEMFGTDAYWQLKCEGENYGNGVSEYALAVQYFTKDTFKEITNCDSLDEYSIFLTEKKGYLPIS